MLKVSGNTDIICLNNFSFRRIKWPKLSILYLDNLFNSIMHNLISFNQLTAQDKETDNDLIAEYYECLIECSEQQNICKRICKEVFI